MKSKNLGQSDKSVSDDERATFDDVVSMLPHFREDARNAFLGWMVGAARTNATIRRELEKWINCVIKYEVSDGSIDIDHRRFLRGEPASRSSFAPKPLADALVPDHLVGGGK